MKRKRMMIFGLLVAAIGSTVTTACMSDSAPTKSREAAVKHTGVPALGRAPSGLRLPAQYEFAGIEHNRLVALGVAEIRRDPVAWRARRSDCRWIWALLRSEVRNTTARAGIAGEELTLLRGAHAALSSQKGCSLGSFTGLSLFARPVVGRAMEDSVEISEDAYAVMDQANASISTATSESEVAYALDVASAAASSLTTAQDQAAVYAYVGETQGSASYWAPSGGGGAALDSVYAMRLFRRAPFPWAEFGRVVAADGGGCVGALRGMRYLPISWSPQVLIAGCAFAAAGVSIYAL